MIAPPIPASEPERLQALSALRLLDTPLDERFERVTRLAQRMFKVSVSAVSLVDEQRQWFKSIQGSALKETSREVSFCGHVVASGEMTVIRDVHQDARFADNPLVVGAPGIAFYAGCPVRTADGHSVGTLCLIDDMPRLFDAADMEALRDLAAMVEDAINQQGVSEQQRGLIEELGRVRLNAAVNPVTRVWNQGAMHELLRRELRGGSRNSAGLGLMLIHAKLTGVDDADDQQRQLAGRIVACVRPEDAVGHYGQDRYLVILSDCTREVLASVRVRALTQLNRPGEYRGHLLAIQADIGIAWCKPQGEESVAGFLLAAEDHLAAQGVAISPAPESAPVPTAAPTPSSTAGTTYYVNQGVPKQTVERLEAFLASLSP